MTPSTSEDDSSLFLLPLLFQPPHHVRRPAIRRPYGRHGRNHSIPTLHPPLPLELLQCIFTYAMQPSCLDIDIAEKTLLRETILACAQVCSLWRNAARGYSPLWVHAIDFRKHSPGAVAELLPLSRPHLINVGHRSAPFKMERDLDFFVLLLLRHDRARIREWNVQISSSFCPLANTRWIFGSIGCASSRSIQVLRWSGTVHSPAGALPTIGPSLHKLHLHDTNLELHYWMDLSNLTELSVSSKNAQSIKYSAMEWFALLRGTHRLRFLALEEAMEMHSELDVALSNSLPDDIVLPYLRLVSLAESKGHAVTMALIIFVTIRKPDTCGLQLNLPPLTELVGRHRDDANLEHINGWFAIVSASLRGFAGNGQPDRLQAPSRVEISVQSHCDTEIYFTLGTVPNAITKLNWNDGQGTEGVERYIDNYFGGTLLPSPLPIHPPFSVTLRSPGANDITTISNLLSLATTPSIRIAIDPHLALSGRLDHIVDGMLGQLSGAREAKTLFLNKGAFVALVPRLQGSECITSPILPKLKYIFVESMTSKADTGAVGNEVWRIMLNYVGWRDSIGFPVDVSWCAGDGGADD